MISKAAAYTMMESLLETAGVSFDDLSRVWLSGAFPAHSDLESAITIGMFPDLPREKYGVVKNTSLEGARQLLLDAALLQEAEALPERIYSSGQFKLKWTFTGRRKSIFLYYFRRKYFTAEGYFTRRKTYFTALRRGAISLLVGHIPMSNQLTGGFFIVPCPVPELYLLSPGQHPPGTFRQTAG